MKNILFPTDFSKDAKNAYEYTKAIAEKLQAKINVQHYWYPDANAIGGVSVTPIDGVLKFEEEALSNFVGDDPVTHKVVIGFPGTEIQKASATDEVDLIVMGTTGDGDVMDKMFGSISTEISQKAHCPVWLIPPGSQFKGIKNIMFASDFSTSDDAILQQVVRVARLFQADVHLVHVNKDKNEPAVEVASHFENEADVVNFNLSTIENETVWEGLDGFVKENKIDLTVVVTKHRTFWENLWHKSQTKDIVLHADTPLMVLHVDDEKALA